MAGFAADDSAAATLAQSLSGGIGHRRRIARAVARPAYHDFIVRQAIENQIRIGMSRQAPQSAFGPDFDRGIRLPFCPYDLHRPSLVFNSGGY